LLNNDLFIEVEKQKYEANILLKPLKQNNFKSIYFLKVRWVTSDPVNKGRLLVSKSTVYAGYLRSFTPQL